MKDKETYYANKQTGIGTKLSTFELLSRRKNLEKEYDSLKKEIDYYTTIYNYLNNFAPSNLDTETENALKLFEPIEENLQRKLDEILATHNPDFIRGYLHAYKNKIKEGQNRKKAIENQISRGSKRLNRIKNSFLKWGAVTLSSLALATAVGKFSNDAIQKKHIKNMTNIISQSKVSEYYPEEYKKILEDPTAIENIIQDPNAKTKLALRILKVAIAEHYGKDPEDFTVTRNRKLVDLHNPDGSFYTKYAINYRNPNYPAEKEIAYQIEYFDPSSGDFRTEQVKSMPSSIYKAIADIANAQDFDPNKPTDVRLKRAAENALQSAKKATNEIEQKQLPPLEPERNQEKEPTKEEIER